MTEAYVFDAIRTPRGKGKKDGSLHEVKPVNLLAGVLQELQRRNDFDTAQVDAVVVGKHRVEAIHLARVVKIGKAHENDLVAKIQVGGTHIRVRSIDDGMVGNGLDRTGRAVEIQQALIAAGVHRHL